MEERIEQLMKSLDLTREEAIELLEDDYKIDHNEKMPFDLTCSTTALTISSLQPACVTKTWSVTILSKSARRSAA